MDSWINEIKLGLSRNGVVVLTGYSSVWWWQTLVKYQLYL